MAKTLIKFHRKPKLKSPYLVIGWPDAGQVGVKVVSYLKDKLGAREFGEIELSDFSLMPHSMIRDGVMEALEFPRSEFSYWKGKGRANDIVLFRSAQPVFNQYGLANLVLDAAEKLGVCRIYGVGGLYAKVPHTIKARVLSVINKQELKEYVRHYGVESTMDYHGPTSMNGLVMGLAKGRGLEGIALWGQVPGYIAEMPNPMVAQSVLEVLTKVLNLEIDRAEIEAEAEYAQGELDKIIDYIRQQRPEFEEYINRLEQGVETEPTGYTSEELFQEIERFLRRGEDRH